MSQGTALLAFLLVTGAIVGSLPALAAVLRVRARQSSRLKAQTYESGEAPTGGAWVRFHARYYVVALFFVLFDIEAAFLFPWGLAVKSLGPAGFFAATTFILVLLLGWVWAIRKGALEWQ